MKAKGYDLKRFAQCRNCFCSMVGILSIRAREECWGCGGEALNVNNEKPSGPDELAAKYPRRGAVRHGTSYRRI